MNGASTDSAPTAVRGARRAAEQFRANARVLTLLSGMLPDTDEGHALQELKERIEKDFNALVLLEGATLDAAVRKLEFDVNKLERDLEALDRSIPMGWFREHFDATQASSVALADYATLLGRSVGDSPLRLDRIQFLLTRVTSFFMSPEDASPARRRELLAEALPPVEVDAASRQTAVAFLQDAAKRVSGFTRLNEVISSGFFVDIRGYKLSLRQKLLDPEVMAAAIELNEAVNDNMRRLAEADAPAGKEIEAHLQEVDTHLKSIFKQLREDETATQERFDSWLRRNAEKRAAKQKRPTFVPPGKQKPRSPYQRAAIMAGILATLLLVAWLRWPGGGGLRELSQADVASISAVLTSGTAAPRNNPRIFVGQVDRSRWALMSLDERRGEAQAIAQKLAARGWLSGTVLMEQQVVVQIEQGKILLVQ